MAVSNLLRSTHQALLPILDILFQSITPRTVVTTRAANFPQPSFYLTISGPIFYKLVITRNTGRKGIFPPRLATRRYQERSLQITDLQSRDRSIIKYHCHCDILFVFGRQTQAILLRAPAQRLGGVAISKSTNFQRKFLS